MNLFMKHEKGAGALPLLLVLFVVLAGAVFLYWSWHSGSVRGGAGDRAEAPLSGPQGTSDAPPFSLRDVKGEEYPSSRFAGKPTVINFFTTWCPSCREEIPGFLDVYDKYKGDGFGLIGIALDTDPKVLSDFITAQRIGYKVLLGDLATVQAYGGFTTVPTTFFIGKDGKVKNVLVGYISREAFEREVGELM
jgi:peroxiredoxin